MEPYLGSLLIFGGNFAIRGYALCNGQTLPISAYTALFSILGTFYGGNGVNNFQLPDMQGRVPIGMGNGIGLSPYVIGQKGGTEAISLTTQNLPAHSHTVPALSVTVNVSNTQATSPTASAGTNTLSQPYDPVALNAVNLYSNAAANTVITTGATTVAGNTGLTGGNIPVSIIQPYLAINFQIALTGVFPSRN
ncbi:phage tail protein [Dinghuibacter silviterrae]|uniref:Microcystin-dependent protein n=1 Tax=Dinghuibacter silviterrae TaxID=1539049 RepID=A0A4R8DUX1_9BACT|nr:tail fiber protein [Dinghuibacter silviterrae]TDX01979.1 microcystin-dependent protein [Dinghuibacter silviterrae]